MAVSSSTQVQAKEWSKAAGEYEDVFLDPFLPGVVNPLPVALKGVPKSKRGSVADLGCGTGVLLPLLLDLFGEVVAFDFAPGMIERSKERLGDRAGDVVFENRPMKAVADYAGQFDVAVAVNSVIMPDVREIDASLAGIARALKPGGRFFGIVPSLDALYYQSMLIMDHALDDGSTPREAERLAAHHVEHSLYDFAFGRFTFRGLYQKFWQPFELEFRLTKAGFEQIRLEKVLYPWDDNLPRGAEFADHPRSWDWFFEARVPE